MKVLFINLPYQGHVIPTLGLTRALVQAGHPVTYLLPRDWEGHLSGSGTTFLGYENSPKLDKQIRNAFLKAEEVIDAFDLVIYEQFFFLGKHLAQKHGKKCVRVFTAPATNRVLMDRILSSGGPMGIFRFPLVGELWTLDAVKGLGVTLKCRNWLDEILENGPEWNLVYTLPSFQPFADSFPPSRFLFLGPSVYPRKEEAFPRLPGPVIYISLGTILKGANRFFRLCMEAFREEAVTVVLSTGKHSDLSRLKDIPENFILRSHVPQIALLKQSSLFITHGGMNSVSEAIVQGVPMVVIPFVSDQPVNAEQVARLGLGRVLDRRSLTPKQLRDTALAVMKEEAIRENIRNIQAEIACAPGNTGAVAWIEARYSSCP